MKNTPDGQFSQGTSRRPRIVGSMEFSPARVVGLPFTSPLGEIWKKCHQREGAFDDYLRGNCGDSRSIRE